DVVLPERLEQRLVARDGRVEDDEHGLGVAGLAATDLLVARVRRVAAAVADGGRVDARDLPELALGAPETAEREDGAPEALGEWRLERVAVDVVRGGDGHLRGATGQRALRRDHL